MKKNKLKTKDLIYAGAFAALYIIALFIIVMGFGVVPILYLMAPLFVGIIAATIYMMYVTKVKKFGAILILAILFGLVMSAGGHGLTVLFCIPFGLVAELIAKVGGYQSQKMFSLSYIVFNITMVAPFYNLYFASEQFIQECVEYYGQAYGDAIASALNTYGLGFMGIQVILAVVGAAIGVVVSAKLFKKIYDLAEDFHKELIVSAVLKFVDSFLALVPLAATMWFFQQYITGNLADNSHLIAFAILLGGVILRILSITTSTSMNTPPSMPPLLRNASRWPTT